MMKLLFRCFVLMMLIANVSNLKAQQEKHFIFIQSENRKPYSVQLKDQKYNSTTSGYTTISQLLAGKYFVTISFQKNLFPEQKFIIDVNMNDWGIGYSLKQNNNGWSLVNIVDSNIVVMAENEPENLAANKIESVIVKADTISIKSNLEEKNTIRTDTAVIVKTIVVTKSIDTSAAVAVVQPSANKRVVKTFEKIATASIDQIYVVKTNKRFDTVAIFIPLNEIVKSKAPIKKCTEFANDEDFFNIRLAMAKATTNDSMNISAKKFLEAKCYSVEQIKNLGFLYLTDAGRYSFFVMARPYISDSEKYTSLQLQFSQINWIEKFKASL